MNYNDLSSLQAKNLIDIKQIFDAWRMASLQYRANYVGGMVWKTVNNTDYLIKTTNRTGGQKSLGARSPATEALHAEFIAGKKRCLERVNGLSARIKEMSGIAKAIHINRVPKVVTNILRKLDEQGMMGKNLMVVGTNALYGYESTAGCLIDASLTATTDCDFLWDARSTLKLASNDVQEYGLMNVLRSADKSFAPVHDNGYSCVNKDGFIVDLIKPTPNPPWKDEAVKIGPNDELTASEIPSVKWLLSSQKFESTVIGLDGMPAFMVAPDPRAFAIHKLWLSTQADRDPLKKDRDNKQAFALAAIIRSKFTHLPFPDPASKIFPASMQPVIDALCADALSDSEIETHLFVPLKM